MRKLARLLALVALLSAMMMVTTTALALDGGESLAEATTISVGQYGHGLMERIIKTMLM